MQAVSVVIPTQGRPRLLRRAIASVEQQDYPGPVEVVVVPSNDSPATLARAAAVARRARVRCTVVPLALDGAAIEENPLLALPGYPWPRIARQRNLGVATARGELIAHLDDDNEYLPSHLSTLATALEASPALPAAHSWRRLLWPDRSPFTEDVYPWPKRPGLERARYIFRELARHGVVRSGSCQMRDCLISPSGEPLLTVDSSEWLIRRPFHLQFPFQERRTFREVSHDLTDDYLFCRLLAAAGVQVASSQQVTLNYYLGGTTTRWLKRALT